MTGTELMPIGGVGSALVPGTPQFRAHVERGATALAREFREATAEIRRHWLVIAQQCDRLEAAFPNSAFKAFRVDLYYNSRQAYDYRDKPAIDEVIKGMSVVAWSRLIDALGVKNLMSIKRREEFDRQIEKGDVPEVTEENIIAVILGLADRAAEFATEAAQETLRMLTPTSGDYKTNSGYKVGRKAILTWFVEQGWKARSFRPFYRREADLIALDGTFHVLDEKGCLKGTKSPLVKAIEESPDGQGETEYFRFRCFKNHNLHLEFKRLDLVKKLNGLATGEPILGDD
jgi:hypothetical protein